ncbi:MAG: TolC family protein [Kiritimatiellia bacterium]|nr:TolC family protein [Kiritimatiellia bacterium]
MKMNLFPSRKTLAVVGWMAATVAVRAVTLDEAVRAALENSPTLMAAESRILAAQGMLRQARSGDYPMLGISASYTRTDNPPQAFMMTLNQRQLNMADPTFNPNEPADTDNVRGSLGAQWRIFDRQRDAAQTQARFGVEAAGEGLAAARNQLIYEVTRGFYGILQARSFGEVQAESIRSIEESLRIAKERLAAGSAMRTDVLHLETQLAQAREDLIKIRNNTQWAVAALNAAIGAERVAEETLQAPGPVSLEEPPPACTDPTAYEKRPELRAARMMRRIKEQEIKKARGGYSPTLSVMASLDADSDGTESFESSYLVGVVAELRIFDAGRTGGAVQAARAEMEAARAEEEQARLMLQLDLKQAFFGVRSAWERLGVTRRSLENATEAQRIIREQYEQGAADISLLLQTQVGVTAMQTRHVAAQYDYLTALSNLKRAKGEAAQP